MRRPFSVQDINSAAQLIAGCESLWIGAGAGMGVDSGLPDFRGHEGFWNAYPPYRHLGLSFYDLADPVWFDDKPHQAWGFYGHRLNLYRDTEPHAGFDILLKWAKLKDNNYFVFTSNVDCQFQKAGFEPDKIVEYHGSMEHLQCSRPCSVEIWSANETLISINQETMQAHDPLPRCSRCGAVSRPNILMFGDSSWLGQQSHDQMMRYQAWGLSNGESQLVLEFGAGTAVPSVRYESSRQAGSLIRVNPREPQITGDGLSIAGRALEFLRAVDQRLESYLE